MSRSRKRNPVLKYAPQSGRQGKSVAWAKNRANRKVRRYKGDLSDGCFYKLFYEKWDIHDVVMNDFTYTDIEWYTEWYGEEEAVRHWKKYYYWK